MRFVRHKLFALCFLPGVVRRSDQHLNGKRIPLRSVVCQTPGLEGRVREVPTGRQPVAHEQFDRGGRLDFGGCPFAVCLSPPLFAERQATPGARQGDCLLIRLRSHEH